MWRYLVVLTSCCVSQIEVARDAAVIECTGSGFFRWFDSSGQLQQQFTAETIPPTTFSCVRCALTRDSWGLVFEYPVVFAMVAFWQPVLPQ